MVFSVNSELLSACVLSLLYEEKSYGYKLTQELKAIIEISVSTLYPVLRRLQKAGLVTSYNQEFNGRNRRYYEITEQGRKQHILNIDEWEEYRKVVDSFFKSRGGSDD